MSVTMKCKARATNSPPTDGDAKKLKLPNALTCDLDIGHRGAIHHDPKRGDWHDDRIDDAPPVIQQEVTQ